LGRRKNGSSGGRQALRRARGQCSRCTRLGASRGTGAPRALPRSRRADRCVCAARFRTAVVVVERGDVLGHIRDPRPRHWPACSRDARHGTSLPGGGGLRGRASRARRRDRDRRAKRGSAGRPQAASGRRVDRGVKCRFYGATLLADTHPRGARRAPKAMSPRPAARDVTERDRERAACPSRSRSTHAILESALLPNRALGQGSCL